MSARRTYPRWYLTLRGFVTGAAMGSLGMGLLMGGSVIRADTFASQLLLAVIVNALCFGILGPCEALFAIQRYRRLTRQMDINAVGRRRQD
jgi:hypothetical protein